MSKFWTSLAVTGLLALCGQLAADHVVYGSGGVRSDRDGPGFADFLPCAGDRHLVCVADAGIQEDDCPACLGQLFFGAEGPGVPGLEPGAACDASPRAVIEPPCVAAELNGAEAFACLDGAAIGAADGPGCGPGKGFFGDTLCPGEEEWRRCGKEVQARGQPVQGEKQNESGFVHAGKITR